MMWHTCIYGDLARRCLCTIQGLCCDAKVILCSWSQFGEGILSAANHNTAGPLWALPGQIEAVDFLVLFGFWPHKSDGFLLWWSSEVLHTERSLGIKEVEIVTTVTLNCAFFLDISSSSVSSSLVVTIRIWAFLLTNFMTPTVWTDMLKGVPDGSKLNV